MLPKTYSHGLWRIEDSCISGQSCCLSCKTPASLCEGSWMSFKYSMSAPLLVHACTLQHAPCIWPGLHASNTELYAHC